MKKVLLLLTLFCLFFNISYADKTIFSNEDIVCTVNGNNYIVENRDRPQKYLFEAKKMANGKWIDISMTYNDKKRIIASRESTYYGLRQAIKSSLEIAFVPQTVTHEEFNDLIFQICESIADSLGLEKDTQDIVKVKDVLTSDDWLFVPTSKDISFLKDNYTTRYCFSSSTTGHSYYDADIYNDGTPKLRNDFTWDTDGKQLTLKYKNGKIEIIKDLKLVNDNAITGINATDRNFRLVKKSSIKDFTSKHKDSYYYSPSLP